MPSPRRKMGSPRFMEGDPAGNGPQVHESSQISGWKKRLRITFVVPAEAGTQGRSTHWIPACAGMTKFRLAFQNNMSKGLRLEFNLSAPQKIRDNSCTVPGRHCVVNLSGLGSGICRRVLEGWQN